MPLLRTPQYLPVNGGCQCRPGVAACPPVDLTRYATVFVSLRINGSEHDVSPSGCARTNNLVMVGNANGAAGFLTPYTFPLCTGRPPAPPPSPPAPPSPPGE